jgi:hypothetical protein
VILAKIEQRRLRATSVAHGLKLLLAQFAEATPAIRRARQ